MTSFGRRQLVDLMPVEAAIRVEELLFSGDALEVVGPRRLERIQMLEVLVGTIGSSRRVCALEERGSGALAFVDGTLRGTRWDPAALAGPPGSSTSLYDTLARFGDQVVLADAPSPLVLAGLGTAAEVGCALWVGAEQQGTVPVPAALVLEVGCDEACRRVWTSADGLLYAT